MSKSCIEIRYKIANYFLIFNYIPSLWPTRFQALREDRPIIGFRKIIPDFQLDKLIDQKF
jgi:hypothetical protein